MNNKTAIITGTSSGIGEQMLFNLLERGFRVYGGSRSESSVDHQDFVDIELDVRNEESVISFFNEIERDTSEVDLFINNAGICELDSFDETSTQTFENHFQTNSKGSFLMFKYLEPFLIPNETQVLNILSLSAKDSFRETVAYSSAESSKRAIIEVIKKEWEKYNLKFTNLYLGALQSKIWDRYDEVELSKMMSMDDFNYTFNSIIDAPKDLLIHELVLTHRSNLSIS